MLISGKSLLVEGAGSTKGLNQKSLNVVTIRKKARVLATQRRRVGKSAGQVSRERKHTTF